MSPFTKQVLNELYAADPSLRAREAELVQMIEAVVAARPSVQMDETFRRDLRQQILKAAAERSAHPALTYSFSLMRTWMYAVPAALAVLVVVIATQTSWLKRTSPGPHSGGGVSISQAGDEAFGLFSSAERKSLVSGQALQEADTSQPTDGRSIASPTIVVEPGTEIKRYEYVYRGALTLPTLPVLRRLPSLSRTNLASALSASGGVNLGSFRDLQADTITLAENRDDGYIVNYNFTEGTIYISQQFKGGAPAVLRETETSLLAPDVIGQIKFSDLPSDSELIGIANRFLSDHGISRFGLGQPEVRKDFLIYQTGLAEDQMFAPADLTVIYPWDINGQAVTDEGGYPYGMSVSVNAMTKQVTNVGNLTPLTFQSSDYALETNTETILAVAKRGGLYSYQPEPAEGVTTVQITLGAPRAGYVISRYQLGDGANDYLVPALMFPITNVPTGETIYQTAIVVPIVKQLLDQASGSGGGIEIKPLPVEIQSGSGVSSPGSSGSAQ